jgi:hypothetical protein
MSSRREAFGYVELLLGISAMETVHLFAVACSMEKMERHSCVCMACFTEQGLEGSAKVAERVLHIQRGRTKERVASCNNTGSSKTQGARARVKYKCSQLHASQG